MFNGLDFIYGEGASEDYGVKILDFEGTGKFSTNILSPTLITSRPSTSPRFFKVGSKYESPPEFDLTIVSETALDDDDRRSILSWLYNRNEFQEFWVLQDDLEDYYYMCIFTKVDAIYINGKCYGFTLTGVLDSPYQHGYPATSAIVANGDAVQSVTVRNNSDILDGYVCPKVTISKPATTAAGTLRVGSMYIQYGTQAQTIVIDCEKKTITSNYLPYSLSNFSGSWLKLPCGGEGYSILLVVSAPATTTITVECPTYVLVGF